MDAGGNKGRMKADINVTPLVDIVLVLLIIFIVITPAVNDAVKLPIAKHSLKPGHEAGATYLNLMLQARRDPFGKAEGPGRVLVDDRNARDETGRTLSFDISDKASRAQLVGYVRNSVQLLSDKRVFVKADADLPFKYVNELFQVCRDGGADEASIVTSDDKSEAKSERKGEHKAEHREREGGQ